MKEITSQHPNNMWLKANITEERCKRLWGSWGKKKKGKKGAKRVTGWNQWKVTRLELFVKYFKPNAITRGKKKVELIQLLPPWEDKYDTEMLKVTGFSNSIVEDASYDGDESADELSDGEGEAVDKEDEDPGVAIELGMEEEGGLASVIQLMAPPLPPPKRAVTKRKKGPSTKPKKKKAKSTDAKKGPKKSKKAVVPAGAKKRKRPHTGSSTDNSIDGDHSHGDAPSDTGIPSDEMPEDDPEDYVGMAIRKFFAEDGDDGKWHTGEIKNTDEDEDTKWPLWGILYEDGGYEDLSWSELKAVLLVSTKGSDDDPVLVENPRDSDSEGDSIPLARALKSNHNNKTLGSDSDGDDVPLASLFKQSTSAKKLTHKVPIMGRKFYKAIAGDSKQPFGSPRKQYLLGVVKSHVSSRIPLRPS